jgi:hypothetical protein
MVEKRKFNGKNGFQASDKEVGDENNDIDAGSHEQKRTKAQLNSFEIMKNAAGKLSTVIVKTVIESFLTSPTKPAPQEGEEMDIQVQFPTKTKPKMSTKLKSIDWNIERLEGLEKKLRTGSASHTPEVIKLVVRAVILRLLDQEAYYRICLEEGNNNNNINNNNNNNNNNNSNGGENKERVVKPTLRKACVEVAEFLHISKDSVKQWVRYYFETGQIAAPPLRRSDILNIETHKGLPVPYILEAMELIEQRRLAGKRTNLGIIQSHLAESTRLHQFITVVTAPEANISRRVIRRAVEKMGCFAFTKLKAVGKQNGDTPIRRERNQWRFRVHLACRAKMAIEELEGRGLIMSEDETFIHKDHRANRGMTTVDENGKPEVEIHCGVGKGERLCVVGGITKYGAMVPEKEDGSIVRDSKFVDGKGIETDATGGQFVEVDNSENVRPAFIRINKKKEQSEKTLKSLNLNELKNRAAEKGIVMRPVPPRLSKGEYFAAIESHDAANLAVDVVEQPDTVEKILATQSGKEASAKQLVLRDYDAFGDELADMAHTTTKFMIAGKHHGDYHDNYDSDSYFKFRVATQLTYPDYCKYLQRKLDAGTLMWYGEPAAMDKPFYDWDNERPVRFLCSEVDGAPYHCGMNIQLKPLSMEKIAELLRLKEIDSIRVVTHIDPTTGKKQYMSYEVPGKGKKWGKKGLPSAAQVQSGARRALKAKDPKLLEEPWRRIVRSEKNNWGPPGRDGWIISQNMPYAASKDVVAVEFKWADIKNFIGAPSILDEEDRTFAKIIKQFNGRMRDGASCASLFRHCHEKLEKLCNEDYEKHGGPMSGTFPYLLGLPNDKLLAKWAKKAGYPKGSDYYAGACFEPPVADDDTAGGDVADDDSDDTVSDGDDNSDSEDEDEVDPEIE